MSRGVVITGTDTGVGKTVFAAALRRSLGWQYWKPIQASVDPEGPDREVVARLGGSTLPEAYRLTTPCSPHRAAEINGFAIDPKCLSLPEVSGPVIVEGAGGALVSVTPTLLFADLFVS